MQVQEREYEVQEIIEERCFEGRPFYLIKWKGFSRSQSTWQPIENMENSLCYLIAWKKQMIRNKSKKISSKTKFFKKSKHQKVQYQKKNYDNTIKERRKNVHKKQQNSQQNKKRKIQKKNNSNEKEILIQKICIVQKGKYQIIQQIKQNQNDKFQTEIVHKLSIFPKKKDLQNKQTISKAQESMIKLQKSFSIGSAIKFEEFIQNNKNNLLNKMNNSQDQNCTIIEKQAIKKVLEEIIIDGRRYFVIQLLDSTTLRISYCKMKELFLQQLCEYYQKLLNQSDGI